jgi:aspartate/methionine/tyrosine aminotransferase
VDAVVKETAIAQIQAGFNGYTQTWGIEELRDEVVQYYHTQVRRDPGKPDDHLGVSGALFLALMATVDPGDEVIFADPYFVMYPHLINACSAASPVPVDTYPDPSS